MNINRVKFEDTYVGWEIVFKVKLTDLESLKFNMDPLNSVGDYDIKKDSDIILFICNFDKGDLRKDETIEERLKLIENDIESLVNSCLN